MGTSHSFEVLSSLVFVIQLVSRTHGLDLCVIPAVTSKKGRELSLNIPLRIELLFIKKRKVELISIDTSSIF
jgi:hypothetical protein